MMKYIRDFLVTSENLGLIFFKAKLILFSNQVFQKTIYKKPKAGVFLNKALLFVPFSLNPFMAESLIRPGDWSMN